MTEESVPTKEKTKRKSRVIYRGSSGAIYGLGFIGALVYYLSTATTFWIGVLAFFKAIAWPALLVFGAMKALGM